MKNYIKLYLLTVLIFSPLINLQSQNDISYLDKKNGFKTFVFGDSKLVYNNNLIRDKEDLQIGETRLYLYNAPKPSELFGIKWDNISLGFTREKLTRIKVKWRYNTRFFQSISKDLEGVFGPAKKSDNGFTLTYFWRGENVIMKLTGMSPDYPSDYGNWEHFSLEIENIRLKSYILYNKKKDF